MTEKDYILYTNLTKLRVAREILSSLVTGAEYGVPVDVARPVAIVELDVLRLTEEGQEKERG